MNPDRMTFFRKKGYEHDQNGVILFDESVSPLSTISMYSMYSMADHVLPIIFFGIITVYLLFSIYFSAMPKNKHTKEGDRLR